MSTNKEAPGSKKGLSAIEGLVTGFSRLLERLEQVSKEGGERIYSGTLQPNASVGGKPTKGVFGVSVKVGLGDKNEFKVEPFGNVRSDQATGETLVEDVREPLVDVFDEEGELLIVAEMPGVESDDVRVALDGTRLTLTAERGERKYRKQLDVPADVRSDAIEIRGQNGIIELVARRH
jgi:HSP20 family protein